MMPSTRQGQRTAGRFRSAQSRQFFVITGVAIAIYATLRLLPTGTNLNHADFRVAGGNSIEFCDPSNPQFIPVVAVRSPVAMTLQSSAPLVAGHEATATLTLRTSAGKPITRDDLLVVHTERLHLLIIDPSLTDYQHVHPQPTKTPGEWQFSFRPRFDGLYRIFADFTPIATARGLYANADIAVAGRGAAVEQPETANEAGRAPQLGDTITRDGYRYTLRAGADAIAARTPADITLKIEAATGGAVPLAPVMGAFAHLVAFDESRGGFAHLHPTQADPLAPPDPVHPVLKFKLTIPTAGRYVIWTQLNLAGKETFVPFWFDVR